MHIEIINPNVPIYWQVTRRNRNILHRQFTSDSEGELLHFLASCAFTECSYSESNHSNSQTSEFPGPLPQIFRSESKASFLLFSFFPYLQDKVTFCREFLCVSYFFLRSSWDDPASWSKIHQILMIFCGISAICTEAIKIS